MTTQWQEELSQKFGLSFTIIDREYLASVRRTHGFNANPWAVGSRFIISHSLLGDETYSGGLNDILGAFRPRSLLILDEAHHAAPASGQAYAVDSQFTRSIRHVAERFEHRLFLSATPHNGHSNSFSALLEILDPQRFTRGVPVTKDDLEPVMVRRLKSDLLKLAVAKFPRRDIEPVHFHGLPADTPELVLAEQLEAYRTWCEQGLKGTSLGRARFLLSGLQQRLLSSIPAFARTLKRHLQTLERHRSVAVEAVAAPPSDLIVGLQDDFEYDDRASEQAQLDALHHQEDEIADAASSGILSDITNFDEAIVLVKAMLDIAMRNERRPDTRVNWLVRWIREHMVDASGQWNNRRLIIFTEWEDTRLWLERRLQEAFEGTDQAERRIATFTGITSQDRREQVKHAFNSDPVNEPLRILLCTDAAREGINLQTRCHDLVHFDMPWNPARLEQRNGRIDRKLQPSEFVTCRYFIYDQRPEDRVLEALVRKTETIREQLGSAGQVLGQRIHQRLARGGITRRNAQQLALDIANEDGGAFTQRAKREMDDDVDKRLARLDRDLQELETDLTRSRRRVGIEPDELRQVVATALRRDGTSLKTAEGLSVEGGFTVDDSAAVFTKDPTWGRVFDELRDGRPPRAKELAQWRARSPIKAIAFTPPILPDGRDADGVVQVHLEHRLIRRLLSRFVSHGFQAGLNRASVIYGTGSQARVVLVGRLALYGPGAARLHEEIIPVTAFWSENSRQGQGLRAFGQAGEQTTMDELQTALRDAQVPPQDIVDRVLRSLHKDIDELRPALEERARLAAEDAQQQLEIIANKEATGLKNLLIAQRERILKQSKSDDTLQLELDLKDPAERRQLEANKKHWQVRLSNIEKEMAVEPDRVADSYQIKAQRLEPIGIIYLWPKS